MTASSDASSPTLHAYLGYADAQAAIGWLSDVLGFEMTMSWPDDQGGVMHAELRAGQAAITLYTDRAGYERPPLKGDTGGIGLYLAVDTEDAVDAAYERAVASGATVVWEPKGTEWGNYRARVIDPGGVEWTVGTHRPGQPSQW